MIAATIIKNGGYFFAEEKFHRDARATIRSNLFPESVSPIIFLVRLRRIN